MFQSRHFGYRFLVLFTLIFMGALLWGQLETFHPGLVHAVDPVDELQQQIDETNHLLELSVNATKPLEEEVQRLANNIKSAENQMAQMRANQKQKEAEIAEQEAEMSDQYALFSARVDRQYRFGRTFSPIVVLLSQHANKSSQALKYTLTLAERDQQTIDSIGEEILELQQAKKEAEQQEVRLASLQVQLDQQKQFFEKEIAGAKEYQTTLENKIAQLSAQQQSIINARSGTFTTSVGDVPPADDFNASIGFKAQAPGNSFAIFSFGAYTHRNGMSQYGAKNQAEKNRTYQEIIQWYYGHGVKKDDNLPATIQVEGYPEMSFQKYLYGIAEMPSSFPLDALKAQAVAARTYAKRAEKPICTSEYCQVFNMDKANNPPEAWKKAVDETEKEIIDGDVTAQYALTHGGYTNTTGWDTTDRSGSGDWSSRAWETQGGSPWFYKSWYRNGYSSSGANCGRNHPWLNQEEFSDIINAWIVWKNPSGADTNRIQPITINDCNIGGGGGNPYSMGELRDRANSSGGAVTSVSGVSVSHNNDGQTTTVTVNTNRGSLSIPGSEFKQLFNLRAPGYLRIPQSSFAFFNVEHKQ